MNKEKSPHCDIEDVECVFQQECEAIYRRAMSMKLKFQCPVVDARDGR